MHLRVFVLCILAPLAARAQDWASLKGFDGTLTKGEFVRLVESVYSPDLGLYAYTAWTSNGVELYSTTNRAEPPLFSLAFAGPETNRAAVARPFKTRDDLAALHNPTDAPLRGLKICLDPGHIGGAWARMEERFLVVDRTEWFIQEGAMNLLVAQKVRERLVAAGADVTMTKDTFEPVTTARPDDFREQAEREIGAYEKFQHLPELFRQAARADAVRKRQELLFYRKSEIAARARRVNEELKPDLTVCIHFNATEESDDDKLVDDNGLMVFVHGNYLAEELASDEQKFFLMRKLLEQSHAMEVEVSESVCLALASGTGLPIVELSDGGMAYTAGTNGLVYARNLAASRQFTGPVVFLEPYYMNNRTVYRRIQLGDFDGEQEVENKKFSSIFREYADAVTEGILSFYTPYTTRP
jgi:hypothetical protein